MRSCRGRGWKGRGKGGRRENEGDRRGVHVMKAEDIDMKKKTHTLTRKLLIFVFYFKRSPYLCVC
mgnify:CR=1 FL=1